jgi:hypothetical protein
MFPRSGDARRPGVPPRGTRLPEPAPLYGVRASVATVLGEMRNRRGAPNLRIRLVALLLLVGLVVATAPVVVVPVLRALADAGVGW